MRGSESQDNEGKTLKSKAKHPNEAWRPPISKLTDSVEDSDFANPGDESAQTRPISARVRPSPCVH